jgi:hypothetical protein
MKQIDARVGNPIGRMVRRRVRRVRSLMRRTREMGPGGMALLFKTFWLLLAARVALAWIPVSRIIAWKQRPPRKRDVVQAAASGALTRDQLRRVRHAVKVTARYSPLRFVCFPQCLAASALLRRRGISSRLHYGVARADDKLITHTWLEAGGEIVVGGEVADGFSTLAVY